MKFLLRPIIYIAGLVFIFLVAGTVSSMVGRYIAPEQCMLFIQDRWFIFDGNQVSVQMDRRVPSRYFDRIFNTVGRSRSDKRFDFNQSPNPIYAAYIKYDPTPLVGIIDETGEELLKYQDSELTFAYSYDLDWSPDGNWVQLSKSSSLSDSIILVLGTDGTIQKVKAKGSIHTYPHIGGARRHTAWTNDSKLLYTEKVAETTTMYTYDPYTQRSEIVDWLDNSTLLFSPHTDGAFIVGTSVTNGGRSLGMTDMAGRNYRELISGVQTVYKVYPSLRYLFVLYDTATSFQRSLPRKYLTQIDMITLETYTYLEIFDAQAETMISREGDLGQEVMLVSAVVRHPFASPKIYSINPRTRQVTLTSLVTTKVEVKYGLSFEMNFDQWSPNGQYVVHYSYVMDDTGLIQNEHLTVRNKYWETVFSDGGFLWAGYKEVENPRWYGCAPKH